LNLFFIHILKVALHYFQLQKKQVFMISFSFVFWMLSTIIFNRKAKISWISLILMLIRSITYSCSKWFCKPCLSIQSYAIEVQFNLLNIIYVHHLFEWISSITQTQSITSNKCVKHVY
jgi:hypothetical protein